MKKYIQLKEDNVLTVVIKDIEGNETDCELKFDLEDIELPLKISKSEFEHKKNIQWLKNQFVIIDKKPDKKNDGFLSYKQRLKLEAYKEYYEKEENIIDLIIGEGNTKKILKAMKRNPYYSMFDDINELLTPVLPVLESTMDNITDKIKDKYNEKEENIIE